MPPVGSATSGSGRKKQTILLADHDPAARERILELLAGAGYRACAATTGEEALAAAGQVTPDLVLLEVCLPRLSGYEVCWKLRIMFGESIRIMFVSAERRESFDRVAGLLVGADDYLVKPFAPDELLARVRALLRRSGRRPDTVEPRLTQREREVLTLVAGGLRNGEIARELVISPKTVSTHVEHIFAKLRVHSRAHAIAEAYRADLLGPA